MAKGGSGPGSGKVFLYRVHGFKVWHEALGLGGIRVRSCDFRIYDEGFGVLGVAGLLVKSHKLRYWAGAWGTTSVSVSSCYPRVHADSRA